MFKTLTSIKFSMLILGVLLVVNTTFAQPQARQNLILESTFENTSYLSGWYNDQHCCSYSVQQTTEKVKAGSKALRLEIRNTDQQTSGSIRSEITIDADPLNQDRWFGFSVYLKDWADDDAQESVFQWHPNNDTATSAMALWTAGGRLTYVTNNSGGSASNNYTDIGPVVSNQWIDFVIRIRWATDTTGLLQVWMNGSQVINRTGVKTATVASYFKLGMNKWGWLAQPSSSVAQRVVYYDEVRIGNASSTYNDVAPFLARRDYFKSN